VRAKQKEIMKESRQRWTAKLDEVAEKKGAERAAEKAASNAAAEAARRDVAPEEPVNTAAVS